MAGIIFSAGETYASQVELQKDVNFIKLSRYLEYFEDTNNSISEAEILSGKYNSQFIRNTRHGLNFGFTDSIYWLKFSIVHDEMSKYFQWFLELSYPLLDSIQVFTLNEDATFATQHAGLLYPVSNRTVESHSFVFKIPISDERVKTVYIKVMSSGSMILDANLMSERGFIGQTRASVMLLGAYYGILLIMGIYNLFLFFMLRDRRYLLYVLYVAGFMLMRLTLDGFCARYFWGEYSNYSKMSIPFMSIFSLFPGAVFVISFLEIQKYDKRLSFVYKAFAFLCLFASLASLLIPYKVGIQGAGILLGAGSLLTLMTIVIVLKKGNRSARYFLYAWIIFLFGLLVYSLKTFGLVPGGMFTEYSMHIGSVLEVVLFSFALGDRISIIKKEKEDAQRQAIENLHKADKLKDEFLANTSHELRTPLNGIIGLVEALLDGASGSLPQKAVSSLSMISSSGRRLSNLVNDILDYSKLRHREIELRKRTFDLQPVADAVLRLFRPLLGKKNLKLINAVRPRECILFADEDRVQQILLNLVGNAIKFTDEGTVVVAAVRLEDLVEISIEDTGIGIPESAHERIFESFEQLDGSISRTYGGTGLGLSLARQLVQLHGGELRLHSKVGEGSKFFFTLPAGERGALSEEEPNTLRLESLKEDASFAIEAEVATESTADRYFSILAGNKEYDRALVHVVDDDMVNLQVLEDHLSIHNYDVEKSISGEDALYKINNGRIPDLVLLDIMMPRMSGYEVAAELRKDFSLFDLPIMMLTAKNRVDDMIEGFMQGANDYLTKPFHKNELLARVKTLVTLKTAVKENKRLFSIDKEFEVARRILQTAIPEGVPVLSSIDIAVKYIPMESVGGDYYDFHITGEGKIGVFISDVSGHGISAALIAAMVKIAFSTMDGIAEMPGKLLTEMNTMLMGNLSGHFLTAAYFSLDTDTRKLRYARAGHEPLVIHRRRTNEFLKYLPRGRAMGIVKTCNHEVIELTVVPSDRIILYTDGIIEAMNPRGDMFGSRRFMELVMGNVGVSAKELTDLILGQLFKWTGRSRSLDDDFSLVVVDIK